MLSLNDEWYNLDNVEVLAHLRVELCKTASTLLGEKYKEKGGIYVGLEMLFPMLHLHGAWSLKLKGAL